MILIPVAYCKESGDADWDNASCLAGRIHPSQDLVGTKGRQGIKKWRTYQLLLRLILSMRQRDKVVQVSICRV
eukprot:scaffold19845_cov34-Attheya_sp.AAC.8